MPDLTKDTNTGIGHYVDGVTHVLIEFGNSRKIPGDQMDKRTRSSPTSLWLFLATFCLIFYGMGASFVESFVNYPTWPLIGANEFRDYHRTLGSLIIGYMVIPMLVGTFLTFLLIWIRPKQIPVWVVLLALALQLMIWISTATMQLPIQFQLSADGLSIPAIERLIFTNLWFRKVPQVITSVLFIWMMYLLVRESTDLKRYDQ